MVTNSFTITDGYHNRIQMASNGRVYVGAKNCSFSAHSAPHEALDCGVEQMLGFASNLDVPVPMALVDLEVPDVNDANLCRLQAAQGDRCVDRCLCLFAAIGGQENPAKALGGVHDESVSPVQQPPQGRLTRDWKVRRSAAECGSSRRSGPNGPDLTGPPTIPH